MSNLKKETLYKKKKKMRNFKKYKNKKNPFIFLDVKLLFKTI